MTLLLDCRRIQTEYGLSRRSTYALMRRCRKVRDPEVRKVYVYREDVERELRAMTRTA